MASKAFSATVRPWLKRVSAADRVGLLPFPVQIHLLSWYDTLQSASWFRHMSVVKWDFALARVSLIQSGVDVVRVCGDSIHSCVDPCYRRCDE